MAQPRQEPQTPRFIVLAPPLDERVAGHERFGVVEEGVVAARGTGVGAHEQGRPGPPERRAKAAVKTEKRAVAEFAKEPPFARLGLDEFHVHRAAERPRAIAGPIRPARHREPLHKGRRQTAQVKATSGQAVERQPIEHHRHLLR